MLTELCRHKPKENRSTGDKANSLAEQPNHPGLGGSNSPAHKEEKRHHISYLGLWTSTFSPFNHSWAESLDGKKNIIQDQPAVHITCPPRFNKNKRSGMHSSSKWKILEWENPQKTWICLSQADPILMPSYPANVWTSACVSGRRTAPCTSACDSVCADGRGTSAGCDGECLGCLSSLDEHKATTILLAISINILFVGFFFSLL